MRVFLPAADIANGAPMVEENDHQYTDEFASKVYVWPVWPSMVPHPVTTPSPGMWLFSMPLRVGSNEGLGVALN